MPADGAPDTTPALWHEGDTFIPRRARRHRSDVFRTRLLLQPTTCMTGADAARGTSPSSRWRSTPTRSSVLTSRPADTSRSGGAGGESLYPFFPFVAARVRRDFESNGRRFEAGTRTLLDLHGTNHDDRLWTSPYAFEPDRFRAWDGNPHTLIPPGGGDRYSQHRCAREGSPSN